MCSSCFGPAYLAVKPPPARSHSSFNPRSSKTRLLLTFASSSLTCWHFFVFLSVCPMFCSHLPASAGWTGMSTITNGGVMEPTQGLNGSMLASQPGMGASGYPTH